MTQEEKAKAYDDIIERLKDFQFEYRFSPFSDIIGDKFPELKESEDERIRKAIRTIILSSDTKQCQIVGVSQSDMLTWLEKQGERNPAWSEEDETGWTNTMIMIKECAANHYTKDSIDLVLNWLKSLKDRVQPQSKQEWSGGDEAHLHSLITHLEQWIESNPDTTGADIQGENIAWLKSLRPQKQCSIDGQELQKNLDTIFKAIDKAKEELRKGNNDAALEALCIQYPGIPIQKQWKPSDEQMEVLSNAGNSYRPFEEGHKVLWSLYNDLKKLREE